jgi:N-methylhydantoinase A/oxoprolinase/acetone carboxylase beta subunit
MAAAAKTHIAEKGGNPKLVTVTAFGGAGPVHAYGLAKKLGAPRVIVPPNAGVGSALGFFTAPRAFDLVRSHKISLEEADFLDIEKIFTEMETEGVRILESEDNAEKIRFDRSMDMRFIGQGAETNIPIDRRDFINIKKEDVRNHFDKVYKGLYGRTYPDTPVEFINFRVRVALPKKLLELPKLKIKMKSLEDAKKGQRKAYSQLAGDFIDYTIYDRYKLSLNAKFRGPAIIEERESTVVVGEDASVSVDEYGFLWIELES